MGGMGAGVVENMSVSIWKGVGGGEREREKDVSGFRAFWSASQHLRTYGPSFFVVSVLTTSFL
jgi:hypothetical protein